MLEVDNEIVHGFLRPEMQPVNTFDAPEIVLHTSDGCAELRLKKGQPSLFEQTARHARLIQEPTQFLDEHYCRSSARRSPHTWDSAGHALKSWWEFLAAVGVKDWRLAGRQSLEDYRDSYQVAISPHTHREYEDSTIKARMSVIQQFYIFSGGKGWYVGDILDAIVENDGAARQARPLDSDALAHLRRGEAPKSTGSDLLPKANKSATTIRPFNPRELQSILKQVGPRAGKRDGDLRPARDRLIIDLGWVVGLRIDEIIQLTTLQFLSIQPDPDEPWVEQALTIVGKGKKARTVAVPGWLWLDALAYIDDERKDALKAGGITGRTATNKLFVHQLSSNTPGRSLAIRTAQEMLANSCISAGLFDLIEHVDDESGERIVVKHARHSVHDLRHTYAVFTYRAEKMNGETEPWKKIQSQLGHSSLKVTLNTYLAYVSIFDEKQRRFDVRSLIGI